MSTLEEVDVEARRSTQSITESIDKVIRARLKAKAIHAALLPHGIVMADVFHPGYLKVAGVSEEQMAEWILEAEVPEFPPGRPRVPLEELAGSSAPQEALCAAE